MNDANLRLVLPDAEVVTPKRVPLGRLLLDRGDITPSDLLATLGEQKYSDAQLGHLLVRNGYLTEQKLFDCLADQFRTYVVTPQEYPPDDTLMQGLAAHECLELQSIPWAKEGLYTLIATCAPDRFADTMAALPPHLFPVRMVIAAQSDIEAAIHASGGCQMAHRAEQLVPEHFSCRALPKRLKTALSVFLVSLSLGLFMNWVTLAGLYSALFTFAISMVVVGMALKTSGAALHLISKAPVLTPPRLPPEKLPKVSLLVPLHDEASVLTSLITRLSTLSYPKTLLDVLLIVEEHDTATRAALEQTNLPAWMRMLVVPQGRIKTKPRAMNFALPFCRGEIIGIYDAEDAPHPQQITDVVALFASEPEQTACVQAVLDFYNSRTDAMARFFAIEYATWFRLILPGVAKMGFAIPLGGTSVFFRRKILQELHGWDAHNVTEDADLGIRLSRAGYRTKLINSVTLEEANNAIWPWIKQRSRWLKGYLITYFTHMRNPLRLLLELGVWKFVGFQAFFLSSLSQFLLAPLIWSCMALYFGAPHWMQSALPPDFLYKLMLAFIAMWCASTTVYIIAVSGKHHRHLIPWTIGMSVYMILGTLAIYKGAWELLRRPFYWDKTQHGHSSQLHDHSEDAASSFSRVTNATEI